MYSSSGSFHIQSQWRTPYYEWTNRLVSTYIIIKHNIEKKNTIIGMEKLMFRMLKKKSYEKSTFVKLMIQVL